MQKQTGYWHLHGQAPLLAELTELMTRHDVLKARARTIPGYKVPPELLKEISRRYADLSEDEQAAVVDLRCSGRGKRWQDWLDKHLKNYPQDAADLFLLVEHFGGGLSRCSLFILNNYGPTDRPWRMDHRQQQGLNVAIAKIISQRQPQPAPMTVEDRLAAPTSVEDRLRQAPIPVPKPPIPDAPTIKRTATQWTIRCPYCGKKHFHGPGTGHRVSHCTDKDRKPNDRGYNLVIDQ